MLFNYDYCFKFPKLENDKNKSIMLARKMLPEYVYDTSQLENNPITFPEVKTLIDGITIGGRKIEDVEQILNIKTAWNLLLTDIKNDAFTVSQDTFKKINMQIARNEAIYAGEFRNGSVAIAGTKNYKAPKYDELCSIFDSEIGVIMNEYHPIEQAIRIFLWGALNQFFWDGNKRTARLIANGILISNGIGCFNIKTTDILEFNTLMCEFYDTQNANKMCKFLSEKAVVTVEVLS